MAQLKKMRLAVCGLARNCASKLPATIRFVETLSTYFESTTIVAVENDSKDHTRSILNNWADSCSSVFIIDGRMPGGENNTNTKSGATA